MNGWIDGWPLSLARLSLRLELLLLLYVCGRPNTKKKRLSPSSTGDAQKNSSFFCFHKWTFNLNFDFKMKNGMEWNKFFFLNLERIIWIKLPNKTTGWLNERTIDLDRSIDFFFLILHCYNFDVANQHHNDYDQKVNVSVVASGQVNWPLNRSTIHDRAVRCCSKVKGQVFLAFAFLFLFGQKYQICTSEIFFLDFQLWLSLV